MFGAEEKKKTFLCLLCVNTRFGVLNTLSLLKWVLSAQMRKRKFKSLNNLSKVKGN